MVNFRTNNFKGFSLIFLFIFFITSFLFINAVKANNLPDADQDGVPDKDEIEIYHTDPLKPDTDGDGYSDAVELRAGYSSLNAGQIKLEDSDYDNDGLSDMMELNFHSNLANPDTDGDGYKDGEEIAGGFDPLQGDNIKLTKRIEINLAKQELSYFLSNTRLGVYTVSSGKYGTTSKGNFKIGSKSPKVWSPYGLWMPYWLGIAGQRFGIHELPIWPSGYREGADHLGRPVSHGCIRLGIGPAETIYKWAEVGTSVNIY